jgi:hypothetical protein
LSVRAIHEARQWRAFCSYLNHVPGGVRAAFFLSCALVCIECIGIALWRRLWPRVELIVDDRSVTSKLFWGPGTLPWSAITHLTRQKNWLFVHGTRPDGRRRRLIVNLSEFDQEPSAILAAETSHELDGWQADMRLATSRSDNRRCRARRYQ